MIEIIFIQKMLLSLIIGALIGIERERRAKGEVFAGFRTFMLISLFGLLSGYMSELTGKAIPFYIGLLATISLAVVSYLKIKSVGMTTEVAFILTFIIGFIIFNESYPYIFSLSLGVILTLLLLLKEAMHSFAKHLTKKEIRDAVIFTAVAFIILPLLPNRPIDPWQAINPHTIWLGVVFVLAISFFAYATMRILGVKRGLALTGLFGGFVSSTSVSINMASTAKKNRGIFYSATFATVIASSIMFFRQLFLITVFGFPLVKTAFLPLCLLASIGCLLSYRLWKKSVKEIVKFNIGSPLKFRPAFTLAIYMTAIFLIANFLQRLFGTSGIYLLSILSGFLDVDSITISLASMGASSIPYHVAINGIIVAGLVNTISKWFLVNWLGPKRMSKEVGKTFALLVGAGLIILSMM